MYKNIYLVDNYRDKKNMVDRTSCRYEPRNEFTKKGKVNERARRIEWEHLIPVLASYRNMDIYKVSVFKAFKNLSLSI